MKAKTHKSIVDELNAKHLDMCLDYEEQAKQLRARIIELNERLARLQDENWGLQTQLADIKIYCTCEPLKEPANG